MRSADILTDAFGRVEEAVGGVVDGLDDEQLAARLDPSANSIAWLVWHLTRVQDDHLAAAFGYEQCWVRDGWVDRFGLPLDRLDTGYGHRPDDVANVRAGGDLLVGYHAAVQADTRSALDGLRDGDLDRVVDERWDPPVTLGVRLVSVVGDALAHVGQAEFVRGVVLRR